MLYGALISVQEDWIRLKSIPSANDETTYLVLVLVEDERRGLPIELDGTSSSVNPLARRRSSFICMTGITIVAHFSGVRATLTLSS